MRKGNKCKIVPVKDATYAPEKRCTSIAEVMVQIAASLNFLNRPAVEPLPTGHLGDRRKWPLWRCGRYGKVEVNMTYVFCPKFMFTVA